MPLADPVLAPTQTNTLLRGITWGDRWQSATPQTQLRIYIANNETVVFEGQNSNALAPLAAEVAAVNRMLALYESIINVDFQITNNLADADIYIAIVDATDPTIAAVPGTLGIAMAPDRTVANFQGGVLINRDAYQNGTTGLVQGGYDFITYIHEFGHAMGLAHPHDDGGTSTVFPGVTPGQAEDDLGDFNLNQGIYTMMSYNDSWRLAPQGPVLPANVATRGYEGGPMALDIGALQFLYGANTTNNNTATVYTLPSANAVGSFYSSIWDTGGADEIRNLSNTGSTIDLRAATLAVADGGGGFISYINGIDGGFTIANTVVIENATGGGGVDTLIGNAAANVLNGKGGNDTMRGLGGNDTYFVDGGGDVVQEALSGGSDRIIVAGSSSYTLAAGIEVERMETLTTPSLTSVNFTGNEFAQIMLGNNGNNVLNGRGGADTMRGNGGQDAFLFDTALGGGNIDTILDFIVVDDTIRLENLIFIGIGNNGVMNANFFKANLTGTATDTDDRILYETDLGRLLFDSDGSGAAVAIQFATLDTTPVLTNLDFLVV